MTEYSKTYEQLARFISHDMRMSHVYQPVMLREVLRHRGSASVNDAALGADHRGARALL